MGEPQIARADEVSAVAVYVVAYLEVCHRPQQRPPRCSGSTVRRAARMAMCISRYCSRAVDRIISRSSNWQDQNAFEAHEAAPREQYHKALQPLRISPYDERPHTGLEIGVIRDATRPRSQYVVTHANTIPPVKDDAIVLLRSWQRQAAARAAACALSPATASSQNHFTIVELWQDRRPSKLMRWPRIPDNSANSFIPCPAACMMSDCTIRSTTPSPRITAGGKTATDAGSIPHRQGKFAPSHTLLQCPTTIRRSGPHRRGCQHA